MKNLDGLTLQEEAVKFEEVVPRSGGREPSKRPPRARKPIEKEEGGRRRKEDVKEVEAEKARKRTNRKEQRMKRREDFGGKFGIFVGKIPKGVTREDLGQEFAKLNVPLPDYVDWVVKKGTPLLSGRRRMPASVSRFSQGSQLVAPPCRSSSMTPIG